VPCLEAAAVGSWQGVALFAGCTRRSRLKPAKRRMRCGATLYQTAQRHADDRVGDLARAAQLSIWALFASLWGDWSAVIQPYNIVILEQAGLAIGFHLDMPYLRQRCYHLQRRYRVVYGYSPPTGSVDRQPWRGNARNRRNGRVYIRTHP